MSRQGPPPRTRARRFPTNPGTPGICRAGAVITWGRCNPWYLRRLQAAASSPAENEPGLSQEPSLIGGWGGEGWGGTFTVRWLAENAEGSRR
eukprot:762776-Hanusia_phi.AAC.1